MLQISWNRSLVLLVWTSWFGPVLQIWNSVGIEANPFHIAIRWGVGQEMFADPDLVKKYGKNWYYNKKQVPSEWFVTLNHSLAAPDCDEPLFNGPQKGKQDYAMLPGVHGEKIRIS